MGTEAEDYLGAHRRHALYVTPESPSADLWSTVFGCIQDNDFEGFVKSLELAIAAEDDNTAKQPNSERSSDTDQPEPPRPAEVEIFGCQSILAHAAAFSEKCLEYLVETCCSDVNIRSSGTQDRTALFNARGRCIAYLLSRGADQYARNVEGDTALTSAIKRHDYDQAVDFLQFGMDPGATNAAGDSAVLVACQQPESFDQEPFWDEFFGHYCASRPQEIPSLLNKPNSTGETCLHAAAAGQRASLVRNLLFWGAALTARNSRDELPVIQSDWIQDLEANPLLATEEGHRDAASERSEKPLSHNGDIIEIVGGPPTREATSQGVQGNISRKNSHRSETERVDGAETQRRQATKQQEETTHPDVICAEGRDQASDSQAAAGTHSSRTAQNGEMHANYLPSTETENSVDPFPDNHGEHRSSENQQTPPDTDKPSARTASESLSGTGTRERETNGRDEDSALPSGQCGYKGVSLNSGSPSQRGNEDKNRLTGAGAAHASDASSPLDDAYAELESFRPSTGNHRESAEQPGADLVALDVEALDNEYEQMSIEAEVLRDELKRVKEENARVEKKLAMKFSTTGDFPVYRAQTGDPRLTTQQYFAMLRTLEATKEEKERISALTEEKMQQENQKLATHQEKVEECRTAFRDFLRKVAKNSQMARSGKPIPESILGQLMQLEEEKTRALQEARSASTKLKHQLDVLHQMVSENDMQEQFHVMDFEQLKIENQALNEKIVERNEEIKKLRSIIMSAVQFITHWREKIHFLGHENARLTEELAHLDAELANQRHLITKSKRERDEYRTENSKLRQQTDIINSDILTLDWENRQQRQQELKLELERLQARHAYLTSLKTSGSTQPAKAK